MHVREAPHDTHAGIVVARLSDVGFGAVWLKYQNVSLPFRPTVPFHAISTGVSIVEWVWRLPSRLKPLRIVTIALALSAQHRNCLLWSSLPSAYPRIRPSCLATAPAAAASPRCNCRRIF